jgi:hypothetical protein
VTQTAHHSGSWDWDCNLALEYAAEQLLRASEFSRSDVAPSVTALSVSYLKCISSLLQHEVLLPKTVTIGLRNAKQEYMQTQPPNVGKVQCDSLASRLLTILQDVSRLLVAAKLSVAA